MRCRGNKTDGEEESREKWKLKERCELGGRGEIKRKTGNEKVKSGGRKRGGRGSLRERADKGV